MNYNINEHPYFKILKMILTSLWITIQIFRSMHICIIYRSLQIYISRCISISIDLDVC